MIRQEQRRWLDNYYDTHGKYSLAVPTNTGLDDVVGLVSTDETVRGEISVIGMAGIGKYQYHIGTINDPHGLSHIPLEAGRMPETADEIAIDRGVLKQFGFFGNVGDDIIDLKPKTIGAPTEELGEYLRANGCDIDIVYKDSFIQLWDFYNYKPAIAKVSV